VAEFRLHVSRAGGSCELCIEVEPASGTADGLAERVAARVRDRLLFRPGVRVVAAGALPRFEMKARRVIVDPGSA
jgi:phenylacetate-CoA ligase